VTPWLLVGPLGHCVRFDREKRRVRVLYIYMVYICCFAGDASGQRCQQNKTAGDDGGLAKGEVRLPGGCASVVAQMHCVRACYIYIYIYICFALQAMLAAKGANK